MYPGLIIISIITIVTFSISCKKDNNSTVTTSTKPKADFTFSVDNNGQVPAKVNFTNTSINGTSFKWHFQGTDTSNSFNEQRVYNLPRTYSVKLVAINSVGRDSVTKQITVAPVMKSVVVYLITPRDTEFNPAYYNAL